MRHSAGLFLLVCAAAAAARAESVVHVFASDHSLLRTMPLAEGAAPAGGETWIVQDRRGLAMPFAAQQLAPPATARRITLHVFSAATGQPVAGASVWQCSDGCAIPPLTRSILHTDSAGGVAVDVAGSELRVLAEGYEWAALAAPRKSAETVVLRPAPASIVRVVSGGKPAAGVELEYCVPRVKDAPLTWLRAKTNARGELRLPACNAERLRVEITDHRYAFTSVALGSGTNTIDAAPGRTLRGTIVQSDAKPLSGTVVEALLPRGEGLGARIVRTSSRETGAFTLDGLPAQRLLLRFSKTAFATVQRWIDPTDAAALRQSLPPGRDVRVIVTGAAGPVPGVVLRSMHSGRKWQTDAGGRADLTGLDLRAAESFRVESDQYLVREITIEPATKSPFMIALDSGRGVRFRALSADDGTPVRDVDVDVHQDGGTSMRALSNAAGQFVVSALDAPRAHIRIHADGFLPYELDADPNDPPRDLGVVFLAPGARVRGQLVRAADGQPLAGARFTILEDAGLGMFAAREFGRVANARSGPDGAFDIGGLPPGAPCIAVEHPLAGRSVLDAGRIEAGAARELGAVVRGAPLLLRGRVERSDGSPAAGFAVELRSGAMRNPCTREPASTADDGTFSFRAEEGEYHVVALRDHAIVGDCSAHVAAPSAPDCVIRLREQRVAGTVAIGGAPAAGGTVQIEPAGGDDVAPKAIVMVRHALDGSTHQELVSDVPNMPHFFVGDDGAFRGDASLSGGVARVTYRSADTRSAYITEQALTGDAELTLNLRFDGRALSGRVVDPDRTPAALAFVSLWQGRLRIRNTMSGSDGAFRIEAVPPGTYVLEAVQHGARARRELRVDDKDVDDADLALSATPPASLTVRVDVPAASGWTVYATDGAFVRSVASTGATDEASFDALSPGAYRLLVASPAGAFYDAGSAVVSPAASATVTFSPSATSIKSVQLPERFAGKTAVLLTADNIAATPLLAPSGRMLVVSDTGLLTLPPLSVGDWAVRVDGEAAPRRVAVER